MRLGRGSNKSLQALKQENRRSKIDVTDQQTNGPTWRITETRAQDLKKFLHPNPLNFALLDENPGYSQCTLKRMLMRVFAGFSIGKISKTRIFFAKRG